MKATDENDRWMTTAEAAEYLNVTTDVMRERMKLIPGAGRTKVDRGDWRVKQSQVDAWMAGERKPVA